MVGSKKHSSTMDKKRPSLSRSGKDKVSAVREYGEGLVGSRIKVWWPMDRKFYEGVVDSYASSKKKHRVLYDDGDEEKLDLKKEKWELIEEDDAEADEISVQDESADESSEATPEQLDRKKAKSNGKSSAKERTEDAMLKKLEKSKDVEKRSPKPETEKNGKMGDIGGKIVAAASRMSGRFRSKENGHDKETPKALKFSKDVSESKNPKQKKSSSSSEAASEDGDDAENDTSDEDSKPLMKGSPSKENGQEKEIPKSLKSGKEVSEFNNRKQKRSSSSSEADSVKVKKPRTSSKKTKSNNTDGDNADGDDADDVDASDDDSKLLVSLLKKSPEAVEALMEKLKRMKQKEGEGSSGTETEDEEESS